MSDWDHHFNDMFQLILALQELKVLKPETFKIIAKPHFTTLANLIDDIDWDSDEKHDAHDEPRDIAEQLLSHAHNMSNLSSIDIEEMFELLDELYDVLIDAQEAR